MIPQEKIAAVARGLREAFGVTEFEEISRMTKGHTPSLVYRIVVRGIPYLLKIILMPYEPTRHYACMRAAAEAGVAPRVWYTNVADKVSITDFVETAPLPVGDALIRVPALLRRLHALPPFPRVPPQINTTYMFLMHPGPALEAFLQKIKAANPFPDGESEEFFARYARVAAIYPHRDADMVSSHNDLFKPDNTLFDGQRLWLVDWEAAFLNDRYADLAVVANLVVTNGAEEQIYLREYFGETPNAYQLARFYLAQQATHMFYGMAYLSMGAAGQPIDWSDPAPGFHEFQRRMWNGEVNLADKAAKIEYGRVHWERLKQNMRQPRFDEALGIVAQGNGRE